MAHAIEVAGLTKRFGPVLAVDDLSFTADEGRVVGFLGPERGRQDDHAADAARAREPDVRRRDRARAAVREPRRPGAHRRRGARRRDAAPGPQRPQPPARARRKAAGDRRPAGGRAAASSSRSRDAANRRAGGYSLGMRQRLGLAAALLGDPKVLVLDEPANGLDPQGIRWLRDFLRTLAGEGRAVLVSSHVLAEVAQTADDVVVIDKGRSVAQAPLEEIMARSGGGMQRRRPGRAQARRHPLRRRARRSAATPTQILGRGPHGRADRPRGRRAPARDLRARRPSGRASRRSTSSSPAPTGGPS